MLCRLASGMGTLGHLVMVLLIRVSAVRGATLPKDCNQTSFESKYDATSLNVCNSTCREQTHHALLEVYQALSKGNDGQSSLPSSITSTLHVWPDPNATCEACTQCRSDEAKCGPGPPYCCWRGVNCCRYFKKISPDTECALFSVVRLSLRTLGLNGHLDKALPALQLLHKWGLLYLELDGNDLEGTIPAELASLKDLRGLSLSNNWLNGTIPASLAAMQQLSSLDLNFNKLTGTIGDSLCRGMLASQLQYLFLRGNGFSGPIELRNCTMLMNVDIQDNNISGPIPVGLQNAYLSILRVGNNVITGTLPSDLWLLPSFAILDAPNNSISGTLPDGISQSGLLTSLLLSNNNISGTIPESLGTISQLSKLDLSFNSKLQGTIPDLSRVMGLQILNLRNTMVYGSIPYSLAELPFLSLVDIRNTLMTCCNSSKQAAAARQNSSLLPSFLVFSSTNAAPTHQMGNMPDGLPDPGANMVCLTIERNPEDAAVDTVLEPVNLTLSQLWQVDPEYFWFQSCRCLAGFDPVDETAQYHRRWCGEDNTCITLYVMGCTPHNSRPLVITLATVLSVSSCVFVLLTYCLCCRRVSKFQRQLRHFKQGLAGMPRSGKMSIVVTDIQGYSDMMKRYPEQTMKALSIHNAVIRKAKYLNCGFTLEQEGDSFCIVFRDTLDAVAFCLQVQQALLKEEWPAFLSSGVSQTKANAGLTKQQGRQHSTNLSLFLKRHRSKKTLTDHESKSTAPAAGQPGRSSSGGTKAAGTFVSRTGLVDLFRGAGTQQKLFNGLQVRMGVATGFVETQTYGRDGIKNSPLHEMAKIISDAGSGGQILMCQHSFTDVMDCLRLLGSTDANGINYRRMSSKKSALDHICCSPSSEANEAVVLDMGEYESPLLPLLPFAPLVGNIGRQLWPWARWKLRQGQQHLPEHLPLVQQQVQRTALSFSGGASIDKASFRRHAHRLRLYQILSPALAGRAWVWGNKMSLKEDWRCTDMPYFDAPGALESPPEAASSFTAGSRGSVHSSSNASHGLQQPSTEEEKHPMVQPQPHSSPFIGSMNGSHPKQQLEGLSEAEDAAELVHGGNAGPTAAEPSSGLPSVTASHSNRQWRLFSNNGGMPPPAAAGASSRSPGPSWGGGEVQLTARPPPRDNGGAGGSGGTTSLCAAPLLGQPVLPQLAMPMVTIAFVCVEGAAALKRRRSVCREIHLLLSTALRDVLRFVPGGGYWCQHWAGDLKYMVAFSSPRAALEWCLLVQELTMYLPWSQQVLMAKGCMVEYDMRGQVVFRGPRLKVGVCEGVPQGVMPDHLGRADYYGASVNQAARYMDAAAHGGQVVADLGLMKGVVKEWQEAAAARARLQQQQQQQTERGGSEAEFSPTAERLAAAVAAVEAEGGELEAASGLGEGSIVANVPTEEQQQEVEDLLKVNSSPELIDLPSGRAQRQPPPSKFRSSVSVSLPWSAPMARSAAAEPMADFVGAATDSQQQQYGRLVSQYRHTDVHTRSTWVTLHWCGMFCFKGTAEPVPMIRAECCALNGRTFPSEPPKGKGSCQRVMLGVVEEVQGVLLPDLTGQHRSALAVELVSTTAPASWPSGLQLRPKSVSPRSSQSKAMAATEKSRTATGTAAAAVGAAFMPAGVEAVREDVRGAVDSAGQVEDEGHGAAPPTPPASDAVTGGALV